MQVSRVLRNQFQTFSGKYFSVNVGGKRAVSGGITSFLVAMAIFPPKGSCYIDIDIYVVIIILTYYVTKLISDLQRSLKRQVTSGQPLGARKCHMGVNSEPLGA